MLTRAYLFLLGVENIDREVEALESLIVPNDDARSFHLLPARQFMDFVHDVLPERLIVIDSIDDAAARIGLGWRGLENGQSSKIQGREVCTQFLGRVVDSLLKEIIDTLKTYDRISTLTRLIANCEKAYAEEEHWNRTSAAVLGLHGDNPGTIDRYISQMSQFAGANIASRVLGEIALCVCPNEYGMRPSDIELCRLITHAALVIRIGGFSDAIHYNALAPEIVVSSLGDILLRDELGHLVIEPMFAQVMGTNYIANAPLQKRNYEEPEIFTQSLGKISDEFLRIWKIEMGFDLDEARLIIDAIENKGIQDHSMVFVLSQSSYLQLVCTDKVIESAALCFVNQFSLSTRSRWDEPPDGYLVKDIYPWRFGRRLSLVVRPIMKMTDSDDPLLLIAPATLRRGFAYVFDCAYRGLFEQSFFKSREMKDLWWGKAHEGHTFNKAVSKTLSQNGWQVRENIRLPELLARKLERNYGDVDVLAWRVDRAEVLVIECKDLSFARNYSEIAALLFEYQGVDTEGEPDKLKKHLNRVSLIQENSDQLKCFTGVASVCVVSCLVCSGAVPMQYARIDALANTYVGGIEEILKRLDFNR
jgi:hypothetical protein